ncbi:coatomer subunit gamma [Scheffersomyces spartinae]|uniref:Coatomer subunit gamma n=1 Tax=Scheffersomyces spartinae TaxID=45513 RepID=A0A9P7V6Y6_9ASCO|nr:coatomer subunit gamma [Scheffersomyces spartinae]KAG7192050.1 coatomer subunit gamma [Scheffersomyces spartinae]
MSTLSYKKLDAYSTSGDLPDKMSVFQKCLQEFNASPINAKKCRQLLAMLLRLIYNGQAFPSQESTTLFFSISKLFQHKDESLRQLVYLTTKELAATSQDILMVTASIMKDIQQGDMIYKPNAIRTLSKILDATTVSASERLLKNAIVDKNPIISSSALISSYHLLPIAKDVVKRLTNETLETIQSTKYFPPNQYQLHDYYATNNTNLPSTSFMYQYHALGLIYHLRKHDKMALMKLITSLSENNSSSLKNSLAVIQLIRYINRILADDEGMINVLYPILSSFLKHKSDMVELEACKTLIGYQHLLKDDQFMQIIGTLQKLSSVPRTATRFAAIRLINRIAFKHPEKIMVVSTELEDLIEDSNRSISTLAITTLLKTMGAGSIESSSGVDGGENVDRLIAKMTSLMDEITEDFKIVIIEAIENLALKFPSKYKRLVKFLNDLLRDDGTLELKTSIVGALFDLLKFLPDAEAKELILMNMCEFIEDCEFTELTVRILFTLGEEGPLTSKPSYYIRHIYNRLVLENAIIRSAAVVSLSKFAIQCGGEVSDNIRILLTRCLNDSDDEVRDRAALAVKFLDSKQKKLLVADTQFDLGALERKLTNYLNDEANFNVQFDISEIPIITKEELKSLEYQKKINRLDQPVHETVSDEEIGDNNNKKNKSTESGENSDSATNELLKQQEYANELSTIPEIAEYGILTKSSSTPIYLTEKENEFVVNVVKHWFIDSGKLVLQYNITNTLPRSVLEDITVIVQSDNESYVEEFVIPLDKLGPDQTGTVYVSFSIPSITEEDSDILCAFGNTVAYTNKDIVDDDGTVDSEGWSDEYQIDDLEVEAGDFITPLYNSNFTSVFDQLPNAVTSVVAVSNCRTIENAVTKLKTILNMMPLDGSDFVSSDTKNHQLRLLGKDTWGGKVASQIRLAETGGKVVAKFEVRSETSNLGTYILNGSF